MGAVLEMMRATLGLVAATLMLAGCGQTGASDEGDNFLLNEREERVIGLLSQARAIVGGIGSDDEVDAPRAIPGGFSAEAIAADPALYRVVQINALGVSEPGRIIQQNGDEVTLALQSGPTAAFDGGVLVSTRGFGDDLLTLESRGVLEALRAGGGSFTRQMERLTSQDQIETERFSCALTAAGTESIDLGLRQTNLRRFDERCSGRTIIFENIYWLDGSGTIVASRQYVSPTVAYLRSNRL